MPTEGRYAGSNILPLMQSEIPVSVSASWSPSPTEDQPGQPEYEE